MKQHIPKTWTGLIPMVLVYLVLRLISNEGYGFHRDEFLYLAQGQHLAWGFWSNPPGPGFFSWLSQSTLGDSVGALRFVPSVLAAATAFLAGQMAREMGAQRYGQFLAAFSVMVSVAFLRVFLLFNPVPFDVFYWTLYSYLLVRFAARREDYLLVWFGVFCGLGLLNKYSVALFILPLIIVLPLSGFKNILAKKYFWVGVFACVVIILPNLFWQIQHGFPVIQHMEELRGSQLVNVTYAAFLSDQLLFNLNIIPVWIVGLYFCFSEEGKKFRLLALLFLGVISLILVLHGKSYYTLGIYPVMIAAGAVMWEIWALERKWLQIALPALAILIALPILPIAWPFLTAEKMVEFGRNYGIESFFRWEDGEIHELPQDFADMLGWPELVDLVNDVYVTLEDKENCLIYCSNFGQAGAVDHFGKAYDLPPVHSFADSWRLWLPDTVPASSSTLIYVNDNLGEDVNALFTKITLIGQVEQKFARERGTLVYLCEQPRSSLSEFFNGRMNEVRMASGLP